MPCVDEAMGHQHFLTALGDYVVTGLQLAFLGGNSAISKILNMHVL